MDRLGALFYWFHHAQFGAAILDLDLLILCGDESIIGWTFYSEFNVLWIIVIYQPNTIDELALSSQNLCRRYNFVQVFKLTKTHTHTRTHAPIYIYVCLYVHMYACMSKFLLVMNAGKNQRENSIEGTLFIIK